MYTKEKLLTGLLAIHVVYLTSTPPAVVYTQNTFRWENYKKNLNVSQ